MAKTLIDLFEPEIKEEKIRTAVDTAMDYVSQDEAIRDVAKKFDMSTSDVKAILEKKEPVAV